MNRPGTSPFKQLSDQAVQTVVSSHSIIPSLSSTTIYSLSLCLAQRVEHDRLATTGGPNDHRAVPCHHRFVQLDHFVHLSTHSAVSSSFRTIEPLCPPVHTTQCRVIIVSYNWTTLSTCPHNTVPCHHRFVQLNHFVQLSTQHSALSSSFRTIEPLCPTVHTTQCPVIIVSYNWTTLSTCPHNTVPCHHRFVQLDHFVHLSTQHIALSSSFRTTGPLCPPVHTTQCPVIIVSYNWTTLSTCPHNTVPCHHRFVQLDHFVHLSTQHSAVRVIIVFRTTEPLCPTVHTTQCSVSIVAERHSHDRHCK